MSMVPSVDPESTTMVSRSGTSTWRETRSRTSPMASASFFARMTMETVRWLFPPGPESERRARPTFTEFRARMPWIVVAGLPRGNQQGLFAEPQLAHLLAVLGPDQIGSAVAGAAQRLPALPSG